MRTAPADLVRVAHRKSDHSTKATLSDVMTTRLFAMDYSFGSVSMLGVLASCVMTFLFKALGTILRNSESIIAV